ncbi:hypothetical protein J6590_072406 [Homalodisca vitripennis]|nr:hypothetical protein J6590_072406 [Homalodisca vitripennis]
MYGPISSMEWPKFIVSLYYTEKNYRKFSKRQLGGSGRRGKGNNGRRGSSGREAAAVRGRSGGGGGGGGTGGTFDSAHYSSYLKAAHYCRIAPSETSPVSVGARERFCRAVSPNELPLSICSLLSSGDRLRSAPAPAAAPAPCTTPEPRTSPPYSNRITSSGLSSTENSYCPRYYSSSVPSNTISPLCSYRTVVYTVPLVIRQFCAD